MHCPNLPYDSMHDACMLPAWCMHAISTRSIENQFPTERYHVVTWVACWLSVAVAGVQISDRAKKLSKHSCNCMVSALLLPFQVFFFFNIYYMLPVCCTHNVSMLYKINNLNDKILFQWSPIVLLNLIYFLAQCMHTVCMLPAHCTSFCLGHSWRYGTFNTDGWISHLFQTRGASSVPVTFEVRFC